MGEEVPKSESSPKAKPKMHPGHKLGNWLVTCFVDSPRAWREFEEVVGAIKGGYWIKTLLGICVLITIGYWVWNWLQRAPPSTSIATNGNNSPILYVTLPAPATNVSSAVVKNNSDNPSYNINGGNNQIGGAGNLQINDSAVTVINNGTTFQAKLTGEYLFVNKPENEKYHTAVRLNVASPYPVPNFYIAAYGKSIESMDVEGPMIQGLSGVKPGVCFANIPNVSGDLQLDIITVKPEQLGFVYDYPKNGFLQPSPTPDK